MSRIDPTQTVSDWFNQRGWTPFPFQHDVWQAYSRGQSGLIHAATGTGKTYAAWFGPIIEWLAEHPNPVNRLELDPPPLRVLWITPLRALAADTEQSLRAPIIDLNLPWTVARRTGDTSSAERTRQRKRLPSALITTPESLSLLLSYADSERKFRHLQLIVVDEWHELLGNKRGVQTELCLTRLRRWCPSLRVWGLSATLGNLDVALAALLGVENKAKAKAEAKKEKTEPLNSSAIDSKNSTNSTNSTNFTNSPQLIQGHQPKSIVIDSLLPETMERFPWAGHLGLKMLPQVIDAIDEGQTALVFTNTRSQTEIWYQAILAARPDWAGIIALHHGSLDRQTRDWVEAGLRQGDLRCVVCTSSLDLGVDFTPVDRVLQVGSPKGIARLLQRAGRSGHQPGAQSRVTCVPTHAFELIEVAAARHAIQNKTIEARLPVEKPLDLLVQHVVTIALGGGFVADDLFNEVRSAYAYRHLTRDEWQWALDFVTSGGTSLKAYPEYHRLALDDEGRYTVPSKTIAQRHRMSVGTITSDASVRVKYLKGETLGHIEESFISRLSKGDKFVFSGRVLEFVMLRDMTAYVRRATNNRGAIPRWLGGRLPLSTELAEAVRLKLEEAQDGVFDDPELVAVKPILALQMKWSKIPEADELLIERVKTREGHHLFFYSFAGRLVNEGLAALFAYRLSRLQPITFTMTSNDYGFELLSPDLAPLEAALDAAPSLLSPDQLLVDIPASLNEVEMSKRQFREIARVAGLIFQGYPGRGKSVKQVQASSNLFFDVFAQYDPDNLLLDQAHREVLERQLEQSRLAQTLARLSAERVTVVDVKRPTPFAFPLLVAHLREQLSSEKLADRIRRMQMALEKAAG
ncbi:MAG: ligase-associated DNA damage response DEXH box helicase [Anaerolineae bacterium]|nr:ligase-associated DNA damage response DEXH box helicase [Anaerolineae bacterium]